MEPFLGAAHQMFLSSEPRSVLPERLLKRRTKDAGLLRLCEILFRVATLSAAICPDMKDQSWLSRLGQAGGWPGWSSSQLPMSMNLNFGHGAESELATQAKLLCPRSARFKPREAAALIRLLEGYPQMGEDYAPYTAVLGWQRRNPKLIWHWIVAVRQELPRVPETHAALQQRGQQFERRVFQLIGYGTNRAAYSRADGTAVLKLGMPRVGALAARIYDAGTIHLKILGRKVQMDIIVQEKFTLLRDWIKAHGAVPEEYWSYTVAVISAVGGGLPGPSSFSLEGVFSPLPRPSSDVGPTGGRWWSTSPCPKSGRVAFGCEGESPPLITLVLRSSEEDSWSGDPGTIFWYGSRGSSFTSDRPVQVIVL